MNRSNTRQVTFEITTRTPLPVGEQIFVTGNQHILGDWNAEEDFVLGILLGYDKLQQCRRFLEFQDRRDVLAG